jgi:hypothetical protein
MSQYCWLELLELVSPEGESAREAAGKLDGEDNLVASAKNSLAQLC